jgi:uncharacterized membrane protein YbhN (UPF0104 family)
MTGWQHVRPATRQRLWRWGRLAGGGLILALLVRRVGTGPFLDGVRRIDPGSVLAVLGITAMTTVVSAWRWRLIAGGLGLRIPLGRAVASYYRSQFLNCTLPGGILGDVDRGVRHGTTSDGTDGKGGGGSGVDSRHISISLRSVLWDRAAGQVVQVLLATMTLLVIASPVRPAMALVASVLLVAAALMALVVLVLPDRGPSWVARAVRTVRDDVRASLLTREAGPAVLAASVVVVAGHVAVFLVAARTADSPASIATLVPLAMLVLLSMTVPTSIGGWGPREGVAAWAFAVAGLGASQGVETATTYGVLSLVATLPGALVLLMPWLVGSGPGSSAGSTVAASAGSGLVGSTHG